MRADDYFDREYFELHEGKRRYLDALIEVLQRSGVPAGRVLDVGSGLGFFLEALGNAGFEPCGLEISRHASSCARRRSGALVAVGDAEVSLPLHEGAFEAVTLFDVIEHMRGVAQLLDECRRVLRPGGKLFVITMNAWSLARPLLGRRWSFHLDPTHVTLFSKRTLRDAVRRAGFRTERVTTISNFCSVGEGNPRLKPLRKIGRVVASPWLGDSLLVVAARDHGIPRSD